MEKPQPRVLPDIAAPDFEPEQMGAGFWYEQYLKQREENQRLCQHLSQLQAEVEQLQEALRKIGNRNSDNSSQPPSAEAHKKKSKEIKQRQKKQGPKYGHEGTTRNGFGYIDHTVELLLEHCLNCGSAVERVRDTPVRRHQIAELVEKPVEVWEYQRPCYQCRVCRWQGYAELPLGCREDFSYGAWLSSLVGWLGYGGHLSWNKQRYLVETVFGIPLSQGSLAKIHQWFCQSLYPSYEQWWQLIQQPGVRCVDETSYRLDGVTYWLWVATSNKECVLFLGPSRSSAEVKSLLGETFNGILSSDCWSAYSPQQARAKQKCLAHIGRELEALTTSNFATNRLFAQQIMPILDRARRAHQDYHADKLTLEQLQNHRLIAEAQLAQVLKTPPEKGWPADAQALANRFTRYWSDWFTFLTHPQVKPDNNDAERALRPVVIHRKVTGGARSQWGGQLVALMFSFLETTRLQAKNAVAELFSLLAKVEPSPPTLQTSASA
jgi:transposase